MRAHAWFWTIVGSIIVLSVLWVQPSTTNTAAMAVLGLGALDVVAGTLVLRRLRAARALLLLALLGHVALGLWLWHRANVISVGTEPTPPSPDYGEMVQELAARRMVGQIVLFLRGLTIGSVLLCSWTSIALYRTR